MIDRERKNATNRAFYWRHHEKSLARVATQRTKPGYREHARELLLAKKGEVLTHYGNGKCACVVCGYENVKALSVDHINGKTANEPTDKKLNGIGMYLWLIREIFPQGYQTLCMNCQFIKREDKREFANQYTGGKKRE